MVSVSIVLSILSTALAVLQTALSSSSEQKQLFLSVDDADQVVGRRNRRDLVAVAKNRYDQGRRRTKTKSNSRGGGQGRPVADAKMTLVEQGPPSRVMGSVSMPKGSPWCPDNQPMYWLVGTCLFVSGAIKFYVVILFLRYLFAFRSGHQRPENPWCLGRDGKWANTSGIVLDYMDEKNARDEVALNGKVRGTLDRHDCEALDINRDGLLDLVCLVGANKAKVK